MTNSIEVNRILGHQRAELGRAEKFRGYSVAIQLLVAVVASVSVFFEDGGSLVKLAGIGVVLLAIWLWTDSSYRRMRSRGEQARRLLQVCYGLGHDVSERSYICQAFDAPTNKLTTYEIGSYFATVEPPGMRRLAEMVEESAFFTVSLQRRSAEVMWAVLCIGAICAFLGWLFFGAQLGQDMRTAAVRVFMALAVFVLSSNLLGAAFAHGAATTTMDAIILRISGARGRNFPAGDVLQVMTDYNAAVEGAPLPLPFIYAAMLKTLTERWNDHKATVAIGE